MDTLVLAGPLIVIASLAGGIYVTLLQIATSLARIAHSLEKARKP